MNSKVKKTITSGLGVAAALIAIGMVSLFYESNKELEYRESGYDKHYSWNDVEVGTVLRFPVNTTIPRGRHYAVIAFKDGRMAEARTLFQGPLGEVPVRPEFVSGKDQNVIYRVGSEEVTLDLSSR